MTIKSKFELKFEILYNNMYRRNFASLDFLVLNWL